MSPDTYSRIFTIGADGRNLKELSHGEWDTNPVWSPDGSRIAFVGSSSDAPWYFYAMNADGTHRVRLARASRAFDSRAVWSPDGSKIAARVYHVGKFDHDKGSRVITGNGTFAREDLCVMNADGTRNTCLGRYRGDDDGPSWSPDGSRIAFAVHHYRGGGIYVVPADGSKPARRIEGKENPYAASGRPPDGPRIDMGGNDIYVIRANGGKARLTRTGDVLCDEGPPARSPDGSKIAFIRAVEGHWGVAHLWVMDADGTNWVRLTRGVHCAGMPAWSPDGSRIAFTAGFRLPPDIYPPDPD